tara:strand:+ start:139 stop:456 length:318 start_codon:yes stop_codon:yes gene_type:complete
MNKDSQNIKDLLSTYSTILDDIFKLFNIEYAYGKLTDYTKLRWFNDGVSIKFFSDSIRSIDYCEEVGNCDDLIIYYNRNNGKKYYTIFDSNNRLSIEEYNKLLKK